MAELSSQLWEVLVPAADNDGSEEDTSGKLYAEKVIPVRVACDEEKIKKIMEMTLRHYGQVAVMAYQISERALILEAEE